MKKFDFFDEQFIRKRQVDPHVLEHVTLLSIELAREGREGRKVGTLFVVSDSENVLKHSRPLILDPLAGHSDEAKHIEDPNFRETIKELSQLDGAFVVSHDGIVLSACRYINARSEGLDFPLGLGSRHMAAASITRDTRSVAVVVSESSMVRIFDDGELVSEIIPEFWLLRRYSSQIIGPASQRNVEDQVTVVNKD